jgi:hypothetical protein
MIEDTTTIKGLKQPLLEHPGTIEDVIIAITTSIRTKL